MSNKSQQGRQVGRLVSTESQVGQTLIPWPPLPNTVISRDSSGSILSRYSDDRWDLSPFIQRAMCVSFGTCSGKGHKLSLPNSELARLAMAWWLLADPRAYSASAALFKYESLKRLLAFCTEKAVVASNLENHPKLLPEIANEFGGVLPRLISHLIDLLRNESRLGFRILGAESLERLRSFDTVSNSKQTPYIPERIWIYQYRRLETCLAEFLENSSAIAALFEFVLDAYKKNSQAHGYSNLTCSKDNLPFSSVRAPGTLSDGSAFYGPFYITADRFRLSELFQKWITGDERPTLKTFSSYLSLISNVGLGFILNTSLMRANEATLLRKNCLSKGASASGHEFMTITGRTSKTIQNDNAEWIVPQSAQMAIDAMTVVSDLRMMAATMNPSIRLPKADLESPLLYCRAYEPWNPAGDHQSRSRRFLRARAYSEVATRFPNLFETSELRINEADLELARRITPSLDANVFAIGKTWPLGWHQLRRTGAVNMLSSGLVSDASLQYQLKHAARETTMYYGNNFSKVNQNFTNPARRLYRDESYEATSRSFSILHSSQFISPHGQKRKDQILSCLTESDHAQLLNSAKEGKIAYRETLFGACVKPAPACPYGGVTNLSQCMGHGSDTPCADLILDKSKSIKLRLIRDTISDQAEAAMNSSPRQVSLSAQIESLDRAISLLKND